MKYNCDKIYNLVNIGSKYIYKEKYNLWVKYVVESVFNNNMEVDVVVDCMKLLNIGSESSIVLDYIYSYRLPIKSIHNIIFSIMNFYIYGTNFIRDIYKDYMTSDINNIICSVEEENKKYIK